MYYQRDKGRDYLFKFHTFGMPIAHAYRGEKSHMCRFGGIVKPRFISTAVMLVLCFIWGGIAKADNLHLCDINAVCNSGSVIQIQGTTTTVFANGTSYAGSTLYLLVMTPATGNSGNWNGGNLWNVVLGSSPQNYPTLASAISQEQIGTGMTVSSFNVTSISQGSWNGSSTITLPGGQPMGTIYMAYVLNASGNLVAVTPWSSSLVNVPEPSSLVLLGIALLGFIGFAGRKLVTT
jgi:hypothetical protein